MIYIKQIRNDLEREMRQFYPHNILSIFHLDELNIRKPVTFIVGENGAGKSTLIEAVAINSGFNPEGGGRNFRFDTKQSHSNLFENITLVRGSERNQDGFFLRAESFYNVSSEVERVFEGDAGTLESLYGGNLHERSHGESFLSFFNHRLFGKGLYIFDEPESALSITSQFAMMIKMKELVEKDSQFIIATHSPILLAYPGADIFEVSDRGILPTDYESTEAFKLYHYFLNHYQTMINELGLD